MASLLLLLMFAAPPDTGRLQPDQITYLGEFKPPVDQEGGEQGTWRHGTSGLTTIPSCLGVQDPSPQDGYPGCLGAFGNVHGFQFGVFDVVPPGETSTQVIPFYELGEPLVEVQLGRRSSQYWDVLYDDHEDGCRLWWTYGTWYAGIQKNPPFLGYSTCDPNSANPRGIWGFGSGRQDQGQSDPFHTAKMYQGLSRIPPRVADDYFEGKQMLLGISRRSGTRGGSQGPSLYVRPLAAPDPTGDRRLDDATPLVWYELTGFMKWYDNPQMTSRVVHWWTKSKATGAEVIREGTSEAVVLPWMAPTISPHDYPCSDPSAYRDDDPKTPEPCKVPVCWYGVPECRDGPAEAQQPSFWDSKSNGKPMPKDCNLSDPCDPGTGPHCLSVKPFLILYDLQDLSRVYNGGSKHYEPQPYAKIPLEDIWAGTSTCTPKIEGSTYNPAQQLLFLSQGGGSPRIHMLRIQRAGPVDTVPGAQER